MRWIDLSLPPDARFVGVARTTAGVASAAAGLGPEQVEDVKTCVSEALTNAITAQRQAAVPDPVVVRVGMNEASVVVEVRDHGNGLPGTVVGTFADLPDEVAELPEGGFGLPVIHALADAVEVGPLADGATGTAVSMRFDTSRAAV